jgi:hypothetical protein
MAQSRPPRKFPGLTEEQSAGIFAELDRLRNDVVDVTPNPRTLGRQSGFVGARAGDVLRLYPPTSGQKLFLPLSNTVPYGSTVDVLLDATRGSLTVSTGPVKIGSTLVAGQVNGEARVILSTTGRFRFQSDGERGWFGGAAGAAGADGADGADSAMKQIRREVFYANGDLELYDADNVLVSTTTSSTWTIQSDGNQYEVWVVPSGSTGGSGSRNTTQNNGGGTGGGGPDIGHEFYARPIMAAQSPATVTVGSGVTGPTGIAAGRTAVAGTGGTAGNPSSFGSLLSAYQGGAGGGGLNTGGSRGGGTGGGSLSAGITPNANVSGAGGAPATGTDQHGIGHAGAGVHSTGESTAVGSSGRASESGGAGGGGETTGTVATAVDNHGGDGGNSTKGGPGAGAGGHGSGNARGGGGDAGGYGARTDGATSGSGAAGPPGQAGHGNGVDGTDGADGSVLTCSPGLPGSGGQACRIDSGSTDFTSGRGGDGGFPGGTGGGSGGGFVNGGTGNLIISRAGNGADGAVVVVTYG